MGNGVGQGTGRVADKVAIVTGGASGIGRASAELLAAEGASVVVADLNAAGAEEVARGIVDKGGVATPVQVDIADPGSVEALVATAVATHGTLDVLFNNAADTSLRMMEKDGPVHTMEVDIWDHALAVDLRGAMLCSKFAIPHMIDAGGGSIINTSSNQSLAGDLTQTAYAAAKAGTNALSKSIATQYGAAGIRCNVVSPGMIQTPALERACPPEVIAEIARHSPIERAGRPEDLANLVLFLASDESSYISGQIVSVDGGQLAHLPHFAWMRSTGATTTVQE